ncbi:hypothetical protein K7432_015237, partial [Basidiobolus ranarum]
MIQENGKTSTHNSKWNPVLQPAGNGFYSQNLNGTTPTTNGHTYSPEQGDVQRTEHSNQRGYPAQHNAICSHLYKIGFLSGAFSDVILHVPKFPANNVYKLHSLSLSRAPFFHQLLTIAPHP